MPSTVCSGLCPHNYVEWCWCVWPCVSPSGLRGFFIFMSTPMCVTLCSHCELQYVWPGVPTARNRPVRVTLAWPWSPLCPTVCVTWCPCCEDLYFYVDSSVCNLVFPLWAPVCVTWCPYWEESASAGNHVFPLCIIQWIYVSILSYSMRDLVSLLWGTIFQIRSLSGYIYMNFYIWWYWG